LVAADGGIFTFGDAAFYGSTGSVRLDRPIIGMASTPDGRGYWLFASDGGIFTFGDAAFYGSTGSVHLAQPIVGMTPTPDGHGYWLVAADGGIFTFGDAAFYGSMGSAPSPEPTERIVASHSGQGYWVVDQNGTANAFGDASGTPPTQALMFRAATPGDAAVLFAFAQLGKPYIWGGNGPVGYDCSGLALASWQHADNVTFARVSDDQYQTAGTPVSLTDLIAGDLVFWGSSQTQGSSVYHTAIYVGGGRIVEATGDVVQLNTLGQWGSSDLMPNGRRP
jgi:cell wall-associated NlpC family hydrolase